MIPLIPPSELALRRVDFVGNKVRFRADCNTLPQRSLTWPGLFAPYEGSNSQRLRENGRHIFHWALSCEPWTSPKAFWYIHRVPTTPKVRQKSPISRAQRRYFQTALVCIQWSQYKLLGVPLLSVRLYARTVIPFTTSVTDCLCRQSQHYPGISEVRSTSALMIQSMGLFQVLISHICPPGFSFFHVSQGLESCIFIFTDSTHDLITILGVIIPRPAYEPRKQRHTEVRAVYDTFFGNCITFALLTPRAVAWAKGGGDETAKNKNNGRRRLCALDIELARLEVVCLISRPINKKGAAREDSLR